MAQFFEFAGTNPAGFVGVISTGNLASSASITEDGVTFTTSISANKVFVASFENQLFFDGGNTLVGTAIFTVTFKTGTNNVSLTNDPFFFFSDVAGSPEVSFLSANGVATDFTVTQSVAPLLFGASITGVRFKLSATEKIAIGEITAGVSCFLEGTQIETTDGPKAVEDLLETDTLRLADGGETKMHWLFRQRIETRLEDPAKVNPICITAGTLGNDRDLYVSADHAIGINGYLINAGALVNGTTVYQVADMPQEGFTYYHVETDAHELILANGVACESYLPAAEPWSYENEADRPPRTLVEMDVPRICSRRHLPTEIARHVTQGHAA